MKRTVIVMLISILLVGAACSSGDSSTDSTGATDDTTAAHDPDGVVRVGYDLVAGVRGGFSFDPKHSTTPIGDLGLWHWVYGGLMRPGPDGTLVPELAESATVVDPTTIDVTLRPGVTFSDGEPLTPEIVKASLESNLADPAIPAFNPKFFSLQGVEVTGPNTLRLTIPDGTAAPWFDLFMAGAETIPVRPGTDFDAPIGAGPLVVTGYSPETSISYAKNPDYWDADSIDLGGVEVVNVADAPTGAIALEAGQVDVTRLDYSSLGGLPSSLDTAIQPAIEQLTSLPMCKSEKPFDDSRVRKALGLAIDREAINDALYGGTGTPAYGLWPEGDRAYLDGLEEELGYDPDQARGLLAEAGYSAGFTFDLMSMTIAGMPEVAQVLQQQWADVGVTANIVQAPNFVQDYWVDKKAPVALIPVLFRTAPLGMWTENILFNHCQFNNPELTDLSRQMAAINPQSDEWIELAHQVQRVMADDGIGLFVLYGSQIAGFDPQRVGGVQTAKYPIPVPDLWQIYVKA